MKNIMITGGSGIIGCQLIKHFLHTGWQVTTTSRDNTKLNERLTAIDVSSEDTKRLSSIEVDFQNDNYLDTIADFYNQNTGLLPGVLVNSARSLSSLKVEKGGITSREFLQDEFTMNVIVPYELSTSLAYHPHSQLESIVNISSIYGIVPFNYNLYEDYPNSAPIQYSLSKASVIHLSKELAVRLASKGIRVNTVSYGGVKGRTNQTFQDRYAELCPEQKMLDPEQTIGPVEFLASVKSIGITGHNLVQDGGWTIW